MICADTSSLVAYLEGEVGDDLEVVDRALANQSLALSPVSVAELLSGPALSAQAESFVLGLPRLEITPGYWERAGKLRALLIRHRFRPKITDTLIAQSCLDHRGALITRDRDFLAFQKHAGLKLH